MNMKCCWRGVDRMFCTKHSANGLSGEKCFTSSFWGKMAILSRFSIVLQTYFIIIYLYIYEVVNIDEQHGNSMRHFVLYAMNK